MVDYLSALGILLQPMNFIMMYSCTLVGAILGAIPGLSGGLGITLILPMTFAMSTELSFSMLLGMYVGGVSGSFISAVLIGIPGSAASIATCYDGYPMTKKGEAAKALTIGITASFLGTFVSIIIATLCSSYIADFALMLGPWEYFSLCMMAITMVVGLSSGSIFKGMISAFLGLFFACVGADAVTNQMRFTFNNYNLFGGINVVCLLMGTFALQQVATSYAKSERKMPEVKKDRLGGIGLTVKDFTENIRVIIVSLLIGLWIGFLPGMGSGISNIIAYGQAKKMSKHPELFGTGVEEGIWATECSNNAGVGGALIPMISLGIPGDATTVLLMSAMTIHGLQPGPMFIKQNPVLANLIFAVVLVLRGFLPSLPTANMRQIKISLFKLLAIRTCCFLQHVFLCRIKENLTRIPDSVLTFAMSSFIFALKNRERTQTSYSRFFLCPTRHTTKDGGQDYDKKETSEFQAKSAFFCFRCRTGTVQGFCCPVQGAMPALRYKREMPFLCRLWTQHRRHHGWKALLPDDDRSQSPM